MLSKPHTPQEERRYRRSWKKVTVVLSLIVALVTTNSLVLPAITMNEETCEIIEHQHTESCYTPGAANTLTCTNQVLGVHKHESSCYNESNILICNQVDFVVHTHDEKCYDESGKLVCSLLEVKEHIHDQSCWKTQEADSGHTHDDNCYEWVKSETPQCGEEVVRVHTHTDECYALEKGNLLCTEEERAATEEVRVCICGVPEKTYHTHEGNCYIVEVVQKDTKRYICTQHESTNLVVHIHDEKCYNENGEFVCLLPEIEEHIHDENCCNENGEVICPRSEIAVHSHNESCWQVTTADPGHTHEDSCYQFIKSETLLCGLEEVPEHIHTDECYDLEKSDLVCTEEEREATEEANVFVCEKPEVTLHIHDDSCFITETEEVKYLVCEKPEEEVHVHDDSCWQVTIPDAGHIHEDSCYAWDKTENLVCTLEEMQEVTHTDDCYPLEKGDLVCTEEEREATEVMLVCICEKPEVSLHTHGDDCYSVEGEEKTLTCMQPEVVQHQHEDGCFSEGQPTLICKVTEHTHSDNCSGGKQPTQVAGNNNVGVSPEDAAAEALVPKTYTLVHKGDDYTITFSYGDEARLPSDVSVSVEEILPNTEEYKNYYKQAEQALNDENILYTRLFDIEFISEGDVIEPAAPVSIDIKYDTPLLIEESIKAQVVHFGQNGTEVISAEVEESSLGITNIVHVQQEFSPVAYTLTIVNEDKGPSKLLVDWYVLLDKTWTKVGSTRTGWVVKDEKDGKTYDYISSGQAKYILEKYGFVDDPDDENDGWHDLAYRKIETYGEEPTLERGIYNVGGEIDGEGRPYYRLSVDSTVDAYCIYFVPNTYDPSQPEKTINEPNGSENTLYSTYGDSIMVHSITVYDPQNVAYDVGEERPVYYAIHGETITIQVKKMKAGNESLTWCLHRPSLVEIKEIDSADIQVNQDNDNILDIRITDVDNGGIKQAMYVAVSNTVHGSTSSQFDDQIPPDTLLVDYYVYIENVWQHVGTTYSGWTINGRKAANEAYYTDPNYTDVGGTPNSFVPAGQGYARDVIRVSQLVDMFGKYGFTPVVEDTFTIRANGGTPKNEAYRIKNIGYQKLDANGEFYTGASPETIFFDTYYDGTGNTLLYPLSQYGGNSCGRYNVYYVPDATAGSYTGGRDAVKNLATIGRKDINYYVHLDGTWTKVGTSHYYNQGSNSVNDRVGISQMDEFFGPYGFDNGNGVTATQLFHTHQDGKLYNDSKIQNGYYELATNAPTSYDIYWLPTNQSTISGGKDVAGLPLKNTDKFFLFQVFEPSNAVYDSMSVVPKIYVRYGQEGRLIIKKVSEDVNMDWVVKGLDRNVTLPMGTNATDTKGYYYRIDNANSTDPNIPTDTWTYVIPNMTQTAIVAFPYSNKDRSLSNNYADASKNPTIKDVISDPNIKFTMHNYSTQINEYLQTLGLASFDSTSLSNGVYTNVNKEQTFLSFRGAGGNEVTYSPYLDNDPFYKNHATVKLNLEGGVGGYPLLDVTHHGYTTANRLLSLKDTNGNSIFGQDDIEAWEDADGTSLAFLFGGGDITPITTIKEKDANGKEIDKVTVSKIGDLNTTYVMNYMNVVNTPLQIVNNKHQYFSYFNAADFNTAEQKWYIRNYIERTESTSSYLTKDDYGDFLPFNHSGGELIPGRAYNFYQEDVDYWFGMTMRAKFYMPENGNTDSGPMIFSFAGDDDVYVFIDGKLVLDVGGTHGSCTGFINFQTGLVSAYYDFNGVTAGQPTLISSSFDDKQDDPYSTTDYMRFYSTTIYEAYKAAMKEANPKWTDEQIKAELDKIFEKVEGQTVQDYWLRLKNSTASDSEYTIAQQAWMEACNTTDWATAAAKITWGKEYDVYRFKAYTTHNIDYFYMERGSAVANCNIQFNLPTLPQEDLTISKVFDYVIQDENVTTDDKDFYNTAEKHSFRIINADTGQPLKGSIEFDYPVSTTEGQEVGIVTSDKYGIFQICANQKVTVKDINAWLKQEGSQVTNYIVQELIPTSHVLSNTPIKVNNKNVTAGQTVMIDNVQYTPYSYEVNVLQDGTVEAIFTPYTNQRDLSEAGYLIVEKVTDGADPGETEFSFNVSINGQTVPEGTKFYYNLGPNDEIATNSQSYVKADKNGVIKVKANVRYRMGANLVPNYTFTVEEVNIPDGWARSSYTVNDVEQPNVAEATGTIVANEACVVKVKNVSAAVNLNIPLSKQFLGLSERDTNKRTATITAIQVENGNIVANPVITTPLSVSIPCTGEEANSDMKLSLAYPSGTKDGVYYYRIVESDSSVQEGETFFKDTSVYLVKVVIETIDSTTATQTAKVTAIYKDGVLISGTDGTQTITNGPTTLVFLNKKGGAELPATGGNGTSMYIFSGWAIIIIACLLMYKIKRKQVR